MRAMTLTLAALVLTGCKGKETDETRLQRQIDTFKVHVYVGTKATLAATGGDKKLRELREALVKLIVAKDAGKLGDEISAASLGSLAKQVLQLRGRGAELVRAGKDHPPILPVLTAGTLKVDANEEHCLLMTALLAAKFHPRAPVPIPAELILYEASRCEPGKVDDAAAPLHAVRAYAFAGGELCDLASKDADAAFSGKEHEKQLRGVLTYLNKGKVSDKQSRALSAALGSLAQGAVAVCYLRRGERERAHKPLGKMLDAAEKAGLKTPAVDLLRAYLECSKDKKQATRGLARLEKLERRGDLSKHLRGDVAHLSEYCRTASGTSSKLLRKVAFSRLAMRIVMDHAEQAGATAPLEQDDLFRAVRRLGAVSAALAKIGDAKGLKDSVRGLLKRARE